jgi:hypothetical protein
MQEAERWAGNGLAVLMAAAAVGAGLIGLLLAFGIINEDGSTAHFEDGIIWLSLGLILGIAANVFRREHSIVDVDVKETQKTNEGEWRRVETERGGRQQNIGSRAR